MFVFSVSFRFTVELFNLDSLVLVCAIEQTGVQLSVNIISTKRIKEPMSVYDVVMIVDAVKTEATITTKKRATKTPQEWEN